MLLLSLVILIMALYLSQFDSATSFELTMAVVPPKHVY